MNFTRLQLIEYTRNFCALLYCVHVTTYNLINEKLPRVPIIHFYILLIFNIWIYFRASLSVRVSKSGQSIRYAINTVQKYPITTYTTTYHEPSHAIIHFYILVWLNIQSNFCASLSSVPENIVQDKPVTIYTTTHTYASHIMIHFYIWQHFRTRLSQFKNRYHQVGSFFPCSNQKKVDSDINYRLLWTLTYCTCYIAIWHIGLKNSILGMVCTMFHYTS